MVDENIVTKIVGWKLGKTISKIVLVAIAIAISSLATAKFINGILSYNVLFLTVADLLAISMLIVIFLLHDSIINLPSLPMLGRKGNKWFYSILLGLIALSISSWNVDFINNILNKFLFELDFLSVRNTIAFLMVFAAYKINKDEY